MESAAKDQDSPALNDEPLAPLLAHPLRARIMAQPAKDSMTPAELAEALSEPLSRVAYHWRVLGAAKSPE